MTSAATHTDIQADEAREYVRQLAYKLLNDCPAVEILQVKWDADGNANAAGPFVPEGIIGCTAHARVSIPWPQVFTSVYARAEAAKGFDEADRLPYWCMKAIMRHTLPPGGEAEYFEALELTWKITGKFCSLYDDSTGLLTWPVKIIGE